MLSTATLVAAAQRAAEAMRAAENELNAADGKLGDGDTGQTMRRVAEAVLSAATEAPPSADLDAFFRKIGMAAMAATGSSLGTLVGVGLLEVGKTFKGRATIAPADVAKALAAAEAAMLVRGNARLGDKTALDVLHAISVALATSPSDGAAAVRAARDTLATFLVQPCRIGRARMYADKSIGLDDPGMLAFARLVEGIVAS